jgi:hypothetical protein
MALPDCHSRRFFDGESAVFFCAHPDLHAKDNVVTEGICQACPYWQQPPPPTFRDFTPGPPPKPRRLCLHLGEQIGLRECPTCRGTVRVKVFACAHPAHLETTLRDCTRCPDHQDRLTDDLRSSLRTEFPADQHVP